MNEFIKIYLLSPQNTEIYYTIFLALFSGLLIRITIGMTGQKWVQTYHQTLTYIILPTTTLVITKVISGNIALSLGMIGALSIVRFRNPVKSPFELSMYFTLITLGIAMGVNYKWGVLLTIVVILVIVLSKFIEKISSKFGKKLYSISFNEGNEIFILEINTNNILEELEKNANITQISKIDNTNFFYRLAFDKREALDIMLDKISDNKKIISYDVRYN